MKLHIGWKYACAFLALNGVISELHEQAHITTGRLINGCYGPRDFNVWAPCPGAPTEWGFAASMAGPLFSYAVMWLGVWLLQRRRAIGFAFVFAPLPFARIFTSIVGGGDEKVFLLSLMPDMAPMLARAAAIAITLLFCAPPVLLAWRKLDHARRGLVTAALCVLPPLAIWAYKIQWLNGLLRQGLLAEPVLIGTPLLVLLVFAFMCLASCLTWPWLLARDTTSSPPR